MKILFTHEIFPPEVSGGGEKLALKLTTHLAKRGHDVHVVTSGDPEIKSYSGIKTTRIPFNRYLMNVLSIPSIWKAAKESDLIQTSSGNMALPSYLVARLQKKPVCCWIHHIFGEYWEDIRGPVSGRVFRLIEKFILTRNFDRYVFQNESSKRLGVSMGIPESKIRMIQPGVEREKFRKPSKRKGYVLFVGNFSMDRATIKTKGVEYLIKAAEMLPDTKFVLLGNFKEKLEHPRNVKVLGPVKQEALVRLYNEAGVVVCGSLNEGFSLVILEAMAAGCPIVSTIDIGQVGKRVEPKDPNGLAAGIKHYLENPKIGKADGKRNVELSKTYTWKKFYDNFELLYANLNKHRIK